jgi:hypothetical protein
MQPLERPAKSDVLRMQRILRHATIHALVNRRVVYFDVSPARNYFIALDDVRKHAKVLHAPLNF